MIQWLIEDSNIRLESGPKLLNVVKEMGLPYFSVGLIPSDHKITGLEDADPKAPSMFYCSTKMAEVAARRRDFKPGVFWSDEWFNPLEWRGKRSDLLNEDYDEITVGDLRREWVDEPMFIKSVSVKTITGQVIEPGMASKDEWCELYSDLEDGLALIRSDAVNIESEWRFFVIGGELVTGSTYRHDGYICQNLIVSTGAWKAAGRAILEWMPSDNIVIDIALTRGGEYRVVEFNCVNCSGLYNCNAQKIVRAIDSRPREIAAFSI